MSDLTAAPLGATLTVDGASFLVWAPAASRVDLELGDTRVAMTSEARGYHHARVPGLAAGDRYAFRLDGGTPRPDPASRYQPAGVHEPSAIVESAFAWTDNDWRGLPLSQHVIYELHVGTFTRDGTFDGAIQHLAYLRDVGVTAIELMPVAQNPGARNWGYDGVYPYAVQASYGGPEGLKRLIDAAHTHGIAVILDVVYNHLGPEGNYLSQFGPYFTDRYKTPWGAALNFDGSGSDEVRRFFIGSALYFLRDLHVDGFRLDAVHAIYDDTAMSFLEEFAAAVHEAAGALHREVHLFPESTHNDPRVVTRRELGGLGLDAVWNDDYHHALRTVITDERSGYYADYGDARQLAKAYREGFVYTGEVSTFRGRRHGRPSCALSGDSFVVFAQNHDQVGNRMLGERLGKLVDFETLKLAAGAVILSPYIPLLFMGEEYGEEAPFLYFVDHSDSDLIEAVRRGRKSEFESFAWQGEPPDPQAEDTFRRCILDHWLRESGEHRTLLEYYRALLRLRRIAPALASPEKPSVEERDSVIILRRSSGDSRAIVALNFGEEQEVPIPVDAPYQRALRSADVEWGGPGTPSWDSLMTGDNALTLPGRSVTLFTTSGRR